MILLPLSSPILHPGDDLIAALRLHERLQPGDILVLSSKAVATVEDAMIDLSSVTISNEARTLSDQCERSPEFCQAVLEQLARMDGRILHTVPGAMLTEVRPQGMTRGTILIANAGLDESNVKAGWAVGWPTDPVASMRSIQISTPLILSDSTCSPRRRGVTAIALACCGIGPFTNAIGSNDLFGKQLHITVEATADQLATAANTLMGNAAQAIPAVIIRDSGLPFSDFCGWVPGIEKEEDLFG